MFEPYKFPENYFPMWHIAARAGVWGFKRKLKNYKKIGFTKILDIGSGGGWNTLMAAKMGFEVHCVDITEGSAAYVNQIKDSMNLHDVYAIIGDCYNLPYEAEAFDIVISSHIIEHLDKPKVMLEEIERVLKPGGVLFLSCPSKFHKLRISRLFGFNLDPEDHKVLGYSKEDIENFIKNMSFEIKKVEYDSRFIGGNLIDLQTVVFSRLFNIKANPIDKKKEEIKQEQKISFIIKVLFYLKEIFISPALILIRLENMLLFSLKGSGISLEIQKHLNAAKSKYKNELVKNGKNCR